MTEPAFVTLKSTAPNIQLRVLLGADGGKITDGYGLWTTVPRPRRLNITQYDGRNPFGMDLHIVIDKFRTNESIEVECSALERLALPPRTNAEPPILRVLGAVPHSDLSWVVTEIDWRSVIRRADGKRTRQEAMVKLLRYVKPDRVNTDTAAQKAREKGSGGQAPKLKTWKVQRGDTLSKIAASPKVYGDASKWRKIADANKIRDPKALKIGQTLVIPA
jgi:hypothetical protein